MASKSLGQLMGSSDAESLYFDAGSEMRGVSQDLVVRGVPMTDIHESFMASRSEGDGNAAFPWRVRVRNAINVVIFVSLAQFDFYISGFRIGEIIAYGLVAVLCVIVVPRTDRLLSLGALFLFGLIYLICGINNPSNLETLKSAFGIFLALSAFILFSIYEVRVSERVIRMLIFINIAFFLCQLITYYASGHLINYHWFTDLEERLEGANIFRPAGLFYEPAVYCLATFMLSALLDPRDSRNSLTGLAAAFSMLLSFSLWGFVGAAFLVLRIAPYRPRVAIAGVLMGGALVYSLATMQNIDAMDLADFVVGRVTNLDFDNSATDRYANLLHLFRDVDVSLIFGTGFGGPQDVYGGSSLGRLITETGVIGFSAFMALLLRRAARPLDLAFCLIPVLLAAALVTYGFFGLWLSLMSFQSRRSPDDVGLQPSN